MIINLPKNLEKETTHRYGVNSFKLHRWASVDLHSCSIYCLYMDPAVSSTPGNMKTSEKSVPTCLSVHSHRW